eukprot:5742314-Lingulodinium_polyedra.AAC.1
MHVLCENAGTTIGMFRTTMGAALGMDSVTTGKQLVISDAKDWTVLPRARILLSTTTFVPEEVPFMREVPWED